LVGGGLVLSRLQAGESLTPSTGYVPQLDATQGLILAVVVSVLLVSVIGMGVTLAVLMFVGGRQVAQVQSQLAGAASASLREPSKAAPRPQPRRALPALGTLARAGAVAANLLVIAFVAFLTINHYVLNPPAEGEVPEAPGGEGPAPTVAAPAPQSPAELEAALAALPAGDASQGQTEFNSQPCFSCHSLQPDQTLVGPSLAGVGARAASRKPGYSPELYLYESLTHPDAYVVEGFQPGLMPATFGQSLTPQQQADLIAFLLSQE
jgi:hypothetical protein